jgi:hypothetical protein
VYEHNGDHEIWSPAVHGTQEPAQIGLVIEKVEIIPRPGPLKVHRRLAGKIRVAI